MSMSTEARCVVFCFAMGAQDNADACERLVCLALKVCAHTYIILLLHARRLSPFQLQPCRKGGNVATAGRLKEKALRQAHMNVTKGLLSIKQPDER